LTAVVYLWAKIESEQPNIDITSQKTKHGIICFFISTFLTRIQDSALHSCMNRDVERSTKACGQIDEVEFSALETSVTLLCPLGYQKNMRTVIFYKISK